MNREFFSGAYEGYVHYIDSPVFMYSPAPVIVEMPDAPDGYQYKLTLTNLETGKSYSEIRHIHNGKAHFEISKILQHLMSVDISEVFSATRQGLGAYDSFRMAITDIEYDTTDSFFFSAIYGALDQTEGFFDHNTRDSAASMRLWVNYPQTLRLQRDPHDEFYFEFPSGHLLYPPNTSSDYAYYEVDLMQILRRYASSNVEAKKTLTNFLNGRTQTIGVSSYDSVDTEGYRYTVDASHYIQLVPDFAPDNRGTYLRWLQRDGSFGYWWFENGEQSVAAQEGINFQQFIIGNPAELESGQFSNPKQSDFSERQTLNLSTYVNNQDEFDYLSGLVTSPVVDRLIDRHDEFWQRVNIVPGSYARSRKRTTPHRSSFEIAITLPQRNTIKL